MRGVISKYVREACVSGGKVVARDCSATDKHTNRPRCTCTCKLRWRSEPWKRHNACSTWPPSPTMGRQATRVGLGQRQIFTGRISGHVHGLASWCMVSRAGRKSNPTFSVSPYRFFATVCSTARAGGVAICSWASVRNNTTSAAYRKSLLSLSDR